jgi:hypothetical protein
LFGLLWSTEDIRNWEVGAVPPPNMDKLAALASANDDDERRLRCAAKTGVAVGVGVLEVMTVVSGARAVTEGGMALRLLIRAGWDTGAKDIMETFAQSGLESRADKLLSSAATNARNFGAGRVAAVGTAGTLRSLNESSVSFSLWDLVPGHPTLEAIRSARRECHPDEKEPWF